MIRLDFKQKCEMLAISHGLTVLYFFLWNVKELTFLIILCFSNKNLELIWLPVDPGELGNSILLSLYSKQKVFRFNHDISITYDLFII